MLWIGLAVAIVVVITLLLRYASRARPSDLGAVSQSWMTQHRASTKDGFDR